MNLYRTGESGLVAVEPLDATETDGLAGALLRGPGGELGAEDVLFVTTSAGDGTATALAVDAVGDTVVVGTADGEVGGDAVTDALQSASAAADRSYDALDDSYDGGSLREAHADYFDREPLAPAAFNGDQRVRLVGTAFADDALDLAAFLSDRELSVDAVRVEAFGDPASDEFLVRFDDGTAEAATVAADGAEPAVDGEQWVAGSDGDGSDAEQEAAAPTQDQPTPAKSAEPAAEESTDSTETAVSDEPLDLPVLLETVADGVRERIAGTFDADPESIVSLERGNELLVRPSHAAYAGGVLRYRLRVRADGTVSFEVNIYGGSEAEKERMRAVVREHEETIGEELGYELSERYDGFAATREFAGFDREAAAEIVDEFDRLVRFFDPLVRRA